MSTPWITLTIDALETAKASALVAQLRSAALGEGKPDPVPAIISRVAIRIRQEIAAGGKTVLSIDPERIPPSLESIGLRMVLREAQSRLNAAGALPLSDDERKEWDQDVRYLERIARGEITVESPTDPEATPSVQSGVISPMISAGDRRWTIRDQDGA